MNLELRFPTLEMKSDAIEYIEEFHKYNSNINGSGGLDINNYESWLQKTKDVHKGLNVPSDKVPASTYFVYNEYNVLVGMVNIRHYLNVYLINSGSGHIGYSVRPLERRKGYASEILRQALNILKSDLKADYAMVGCYEDNEGSKKTILNNGGVFDCEITEEGKRNTLSYIIEFK